MEHLIEIYNNLLISYEIRSALKLRKLKKEIDSVE